MPKIRLATFNVENLFARPPRANGVRAEDRRIGMIEFEDPAEARLARRIADAALSDDHRQLTAQAIIDADADVVALQEVDGEAALRQFRDAYLHQPLSARIAAEIRRELPWLKGADDPAHHHQMLRDEIARLRFSLEARHHYPWLRVIEGNDQRGIDVGYLSRRRVLRVASNAHVTYRDLGVWNENLRKGPDGGRERTGEERTPDDRVFRRDCLEIDVDAGGGKVLTVYICHFKAIGQSREGTMPLRLAEAKAVRRLIELRFGRDVAHANWVIAGDLNDYVEVDGSGLMPDLDTGRMQPTALGPLVGGDGPGDPFAYDVNQLITDPTDRWTSYYAPEDVYAQLDHILVSPALWVANAGAVPKILRAGQPHRATRYRGERYPRVGLDRPKASDHCPIVIDLDVP